MKKHILILGFPGSGKSTLSSVIKSGDFSLYNDNLIFERGNYRVFFTVDQKMIDWNSDYNAIVEYELHHQYTNFGFTQLDTILNHDNEIIIIFLKCRKWHLTIRAIFRIIKSIFTKEPAKGKNKKIILYNLNILLFYLIPFRANKLYEKYKKYLADYSPIEIDTSGITFNYKPLTCYTPTQYQ